MNDEYTNGPVSPDDLAAYAVDAHPADQAAVLAAHLEDDAVAARLERELRAAAGELAAAMVDEVLPDAALRGRVVSEAGRRRPPAVPEAGASPGEVYRVELARTLLLLGDLGADDWQRPVDPPELAGWTVQDTVVHLVAGESLLADALGVPVPGISETSVDVEGRTAQARRRHAGCRTAKAVGELEAAASAVDGEVLRRGEERLHEMIRWWGERETVRFALLIRAFETWIHADDIRRACGLTMAAPPPASLLAMAHTTVTLVPRMLDMHSSRRPGRLVRFRFPDLGIAAWDVDLGGVGGVRPAGDDRVDAEIVAAATDLCRVVGARLDPGALVYSVAGDERLASEVVGALPAMAVL